MLLYSSTLKTRSFLYLELKKAASLYLKGNTVDQIKDFALKENVFLYNSNNRISDIASTIIKRMGVLDDYLMRKIVKGSLETSKLIALYTILKTDRLFFEFMQEIFREKHLLRDAAVTDRDFSVFFQRKSEQSERVAAWQDYTHYKLQQVYKRILVEAGLAKKCKKDLEITKPIIEQEVLEHIRSRGDRVFLNALLGED